MFLLSPSLSVTLFIAFAAALPSQNVAVMDTGSALATIAGAITDANALNTTKPTIENADPIEGSTYFYIDHGCSAKQRQVSTTAFKDAMEIADAAKKWPDYGVDAMDMYMGKNADAKSVNKALIQRKCVLVETTVLLLDGILMLSRSFQSVG
jgi:hypothetical protein